MIISQNWRGIDCSVGDLAGREHDEGIRIGRKGVEYNREKSSVTVHFCGQLVRSFKPAPLRNATTLTAMLGIAAGGRSGTDGMPFQPRRPAIATEGGGAAGNGKSGRLTVGPNSYVWRIFRRRFCRRLLHVCSTLPPFLPTFCRFHPLTFSVQPTPSTRDCTWTLTLKWILFVVQISLFRKKLSHFEIK
jgi:hypothetical protein